eukprot:4164941-Pyramimonas_sp.AAC.1
MDDPDLDPFRQLADEWSEPLDWSPAAGQWEGPTVQEAPAARCQDAWGSAVPQPGVGAESGQLRASQGMASCRLPGGPGDACDLAANQAAPSSTRAGQGASVGPQAQHQPSDLHATLLFANFTESGPQAH